MISIDLSGKTILITGALGAIAEHMVRRLAASGATLVLTDIKPEDEARRTLDHWQIPLFVLLISCRRHYRLRPG